MDKWKNKIYPSELLLTSDDKCDQKVNFLDLHLEIKNQQFFYCLFDKRDNFNFPIVNFPCLSGNIPTRQSYSVFIAQLRCQYAQDFQWLNSSFKVIEAMFLLPQLQKRIVNS